MAPAAFREKTLARKRCWRVSTCEDEGPLETDERGDDEAGGAMMPTEAKIEDCLLADSEAEETSMPEATAEQLASFECKWPP